MTSFLESNMFYDEHGCRINPKFTLENRTKAITKMKKLLFFAKLAPDSNSRYSFAGTAAG